MLVAAACGGGGGGDGEADRAAEEAGADTGDEAGTSETTDVLDSPRWANVVSGPEASSEEPVRGGSVVVALASEVSTYLPSAWLGGGGFNTAFAIYDPLMTRDADGQLRPYLAESIEPNEDFTEWTLRLRPG
ncbi:MAG: hypothetical protein ACRDUY_06900, partial [Nitriliruptorales bacterium]